jgi:hypothetical protein
MPRKTLRMTEIRALTNRYLAGSDPELTEFRAGVAAMYEHLSMMAGDYQGWNDLVQVWSGDPGDSEYIPDETYRRAYHGEMTGPDAGPAQTAINAYRAWRSDAELLRRREMAGLTAEHEDAGPGHAAWCAGPDAHRAGGPCM